MRKETVTMTNQIISKIAKLLNLAAKSENEGESQNAMAMVQKLMIKHDIDADDVDNVDDTKKEDAEDQSIDSSSRLSWWKKIVAAVIAKNFKCKIYTNRSSINKLTSIQYIGLSSDIAIAKSVYDFAISEIIYHSKRYMQGKKGIEIKNAYIFGFVTGLKEHFASQVQENNWQMILVPGDAVMKLHRNLNLQTQNISYGKTLNNASGNNAYSSGKTAGMNFNTRSRIRE